MQGISKCVETKDHCCPHLTPSCVGKMKEKKVLFMEIWAGTLLVLSFSKVDFSST